MRKQDPKAAAILDRASRVLAMIRPANSAARVAAILTAAKDLENLKPGDTIAMDLLSEMALGFDPDVVQDAISKGTNRALKQRAAGPPKSGAKVIDIRNRRGVSLDDFLAYMPLHTYYSCLPARCGPQKASTLALHRSRSPTRTANWSPLTKESPRRCQRAHGWTVTRRSNR
jgi:hypothetical protein